MVVSDKFEAPQMPGLLNKKLSIYITATPDYLLSVDSLQVKFLEFYFSLLCHVAPVLFASYAKLIDTIQPMTLTYKHQLSSPGALWCLLEDPTFLDAPLHVEILDELSSPADNFFIFL